MTLNSIKLGTHTKIKKKILEQCVTLVYGNIYLKTDQIKSSEILYNTSHVDSYIGRHFT